jgi:hypothetical protein
VIPGDLSLLADSETVKIAPPSEKKEIGSDTVPMTDRLSRTGRIPKIPAAR